LQAAKRRAQLGPVQFAICVWHDTFICALALPLILIETPDAKIANDSKERIFFSLITSECFERLVREGHPFTVGRITLAAVCSANADVVWVRLSLGAECHIAEFFMRGTRRRARQSCCRRQEHGTDEAG
jgi:hypothetical protein